MQDSAAKDERVAAAARQDLARRLGADAQAIRVVSIQPQHWRDASLGCPEPGKVYQQVLVDDYRLILESGGKRYDYRSDGRRVRLCERG